MNINNITMQEVKEKYYGIGDGNHAYTEAFITKELGDMLINKYGDLVQCDGVNIHEPFYCRIIGDEVWDLQEVWDNQLRLDETFDKYKSFEEFKKGEGFE